jgi:glucose/arabinose dehydrogenase/mono/diheme cytochrome c family protein
VHTEWLTQTGFRVEVASTGYAYPISIAFVPQPSSTPTAPVYYVAELHGRIKVVTQQRTVGIYADNLLNFTPHPDGTEAEGGIGVVGLCVEPDQGDVFATLVFKDGGTFRNKITRFHSHDGGLTAASSTDILVMLDDEMWGNAHQIQQCSIGPDGKLYVNVGNGDQAILGQNLGSLQGKILRLNLDGSAPEDNPFYDATNLHSPRNYVYALGFRNPFAMAWRGSELYVNENGVAIDRLLRIFPGFNYGYDGTDHSIRMNTLYLWGPPAVAPVGMTGIEEAGFPTYKRGYLFMGLMGAQADWPQRGAVSAGREIQEIVLDSQGRLEKLPKTFAKYAGNRAVTVMEVAAGPDGLYFSEFPLEPNLTARILKIVYDPRPGLASQVGLDGLSIGEEIYDRYGCQACHMLDGMGGTTGPDLTDLAERLRARLLTPSYVRHAEDLLKTQGHEGGKRHQLLQEVLNKSAEARLHVWVKAHIQDPRFDNPQSQMPAFTIPDDELNALATFLLTRQPTSWLTNLQQTGIEWLKRNKMSAAVGFGGGMFVLGMLVTVAGWKLWLSRQRR